MRRFKRERIQPFRGEILNSVRQLLPRVSFFILSERLQIVLICLFIRKALFLLQKGRGFFRIFRCDRLIGFGIPKLESFTGFAVAVCMGIPVDNYASAHILKLPQYFDQLRLFRHIDFVACFRIDIYRNHRKDKRNIPFMQIRSGLEQQFFIRHRADILKPQI
ncbi:hypothetical protein BFN05_21190 [Bacillus licheniformis]|nr:hypothetical protein BFN05_21190 [Bacillus licheniformis]